MEDSTRIVQCLDVCFEHDDRNDEPPEWYWLDANAHMKGTESPDFILVIHEDTLESLVTEDAPAIIVWHVREAFDKGCKFVRFYWP